MRKLLIGLLVVSSFSSFASPGSGQTDLVECNTEHMSLYVGLIADGDAAQAIATYDNGDRASHHSYSDFISKDEKNAIESGTWALSLVDENKNEMIIVVMNNKNGHVFVNGNLQTLNCKKLIEKTIQN